MFKYAFENEIDTILKNRAICEKWYYEMIEFIFVNEQYILDYHFHIVWIL